MKYLIIGGAGFIGSHLARHLLQCQHEVIILDDFFSGLKTNCPPQAEIICDDICNTDAVAAKLHAIDGCFHLAAIHGFGAYSANPARAKQVNRDAVDGLIGKIADSDRKIPIVFSSSAAIYGNQGRKTVNEDTPPQPISDYGRDKLANEVSFRHACTISDLRVQIFRIFNVFGPGQTMDEANTGVISLFVRQALKNQALTLNGKGTQIRDFVHVHDVATIMYKAMTRLHTAKPGTCHIHNIATEKPTMMQDLALRINAITGNRQPPSYTPARPGDIDYSLGSSDRLKADFGPLNWRSVDDYLKMATAAANPVK